MDGVANIQHTSNEDGATSLEEVCVNVRNRENLFLRLMTAEQFINSKLIGTYAWQRNKAPRSIVMGMPMLNC